MKKSLLIFLLLFLQITNINAQSVTGVLGAFPPELVLLQSRMEEKKDTIIQQIRFTKGKLNGRQIVLAQTGIGKVNAAITTTLMIEHFKPREIIFSGIAGGIDPALNPGDIVIGTHVTYHDFGMAEDNGMQYWSTKNPATMLENPRSFVCDSTLVKKALAVSKGLTFSKIKRDNGSFEPAVKQGIIVTGDVFVSSEIITKRLREELNAAATEMEGAAIAQTCYQQNTPFLIIRSLSDNANEKAQNDIMAFYDIAAHNAATLVMAVVGKM
ncbi:5'-methylthioadenosine/adenosylhomocysteine nucleosidase [Dyadobacter chenhuakuii]|uniref:adenosylhomocysteine nucleosidase n=1 Tax=Dyadobacter chenhuakuii TaxID=2909339 RepID=A0ABY4XSC5_9BACT|nr:5'-methylthioadenosine/adenosylhomocysteine nucleosidase [Dyadobacter chenhuakuii]MCF2492398.1 5'-methylthioadenosine/adenosylhomocysteine nucleosidase [Dyadobacter chenhuakuii]USJ33300.1 5'-methylthioadenosine/adenosylhomocysteine nucleosidase [Dyadobacter chenhuakuii]